MKKHQLTALSLVLALSCALMPVAAAANNDNGIVQDYKIVDDSPRGALAPATLEALGASVSVSTEQQLREAVASAPGDDTPHAIHVTADIHTTGGNIVTPANSHVLIYGNRTITNAAQFDVGDGSHLLIDGLSLQGAPGRSFGINIHAGNSAVTFVRGRIENFDSDGIRVTSSAPNSVINIYGGYIGGNGRAGVIVDGGLSAAASRVYVHDGSTISDNSMFGIWLYRNAHLEMHGGTISKNPTGVRLGGAASTTFTMYDGYIVHNTRATDGGAGVWVAHNSLFTMNGGYIMHNTAPTGGGVRLGGESGGTGRMVMNDGLIAYNTANSDGGGVYAYGGFYGGGMIPSVVPSSFTMHGGTIASNTAHRNGGGVHLQNRTQVIVTAWPTFNFQGGIISHNTTGNDGGGIWVNWPNRMFPATGTAFRDLTLSPSINDANIHSNVSRQRYAITSFDRDRLASHLSPTGVRWFADHQIPLWNNYQINYTTGVALLYRLFYGVNEGQGTLTGTRYSTVISGGALAPSPAPISAGERLTLTATPAPLHYVRAWSVGVSADGENPVFFTQAELDTLIADGHIELVDNDGIISLIIANTGHFLIDDINRIHVFVHFAPLDNTSPSGTHRWFIQGYPGGDVRPDGFVTRAEMAQIFFNLSESADKYTVWYDAGFPDVRPGQWHFTAISYLAVRHNSVIGFPDGSFRPDQFITHAEFAELSARFFNLRDAVSRTVFDEPFGHWADNRQFVPDEPIPRAAAVTLLNHYLGRVPNPDTINEFLQGRHIYHDITAENHRAFYEIMEASLSHSFTHDASGREVWDMRSNWWLTPDRWLLGNWWFHQ